jgi:hypothetical protein
MGAPPQQEDGEAKLQHRRAKTEGGRGMRFKASFYAMLAGQWLRTEALSLWRKAKDFFQEAAMVAMAIVCPWTIKVDNENEEKD